MARNAQFRTAGETAALLGVSSKALRVYENHGLVTPDRSAAGYRVYGPAHIRRLHQILALKSLGLSLAQIGECLAGLDGNLRPILKAQERDLRARVGKLESAIKAIVAAQGRLEAGINLSVDDLVTLTKEIVMTEAKTNWRDNLETLFDKHFTEPERRHMMPAADAAPADSEASEREKLLAEARALLGQDPGSSEAMDLAKRWRDRAVKFAGGDLATLAKLRAMFDDALANPDIAKTLPWRDEMAFIKAATERLESAGR